MDTAVAPAVVSTETANTINRYYARMGLSPPIIVLRRNPRELCSTVLRRAFRFNDAFFEGLTRLVARVARGTGIEWCHPRVKKRLNALWSSINQLRPLSKARHPSVNPRGLYSEGDDPAFGGWGVVAHEHQRAMDEAADRTMEVFRRRFSAGVRILDKYLAKATDRVLMDNLSARLSALRNFVVDGDPQNRRGTGIIWLAHPDHCFVCLPPLELHFDDNERVHHDAAPAAVWPGDYTAYYWHGVRVPPDVVTNPESITTDEIEREQNAEIRRVLIERYGESRYLTDIQAAPMQKDKCGELYRKELPGDEPLVFVRVLNSTPEPDGSRKPYFLRVPQTMQTAREAVAWTFGLSSGAYRPISET